MEQAIETLQPRFMAPSADLLQQNPLCCICWNDYDDGDLPVKLPCGHVFGEDCVIAWARGTTPTGRHNGCPSCRAQLLPPSLHSRTSAVRYWSSFFLTQVQADLRDFHGGLREAALFYWAGTMSYTAKLFSECQIATGALFCVLLARKLDRVTRLLSWRRVLFELWFDLSLLIVLKLSVALIAHFYLVALGYPIESSRGFF